MPKLGIPYYSNKIIIVDLVQTLMGLNLRQQKSLKYTGTGRYEFWLQIKSIALKETESFYDTNLRIKIRT